MTNPYVISMDGLHRSGKGTQLDCLKKYLLNLGHCVKLMRGHGSRKGEGGPDDPHSEWWTALQPLLRKLDDTGKLDVNPWIDASNRLNWELYQEYFAQNPQEEDSGCHYLLLDRSIISHYAMMVRDGLASSIDEVTVFLDPEGNELRAVIPDISFILHVGQSTLLERNEHSSDCPEKYDFRRRNILNSYTHFEELTTNIHHHLFNMRHIDGDESPEAVFENVIATLRPEGYVT